MGINQKEAVAALHRARMLTAAEELAKEGIDAEVIDLRTVSPWDKETVLASVKKTGRVSGQVTTGKLSVELGAVFDVESCRMRKEGE